MKVFNIFVHFENFFFIFLSITSFKSIIMVLLTRLYLVHDLFLLKMKYSILNQIKRPSTIVPFRSYNPLSEERARETQCMNYGSQNDDKTTK